MFIILKSCPHCLATDKLPVHSIAMTTTTSQPYQPLGSGYKLTTKTTSTPGAVPLFRYRPVPQGLLRHRSISEEVHLYIHCMQDGIHPVARGMWFSDKGEEGQTVHSGYYLMLFITADPLPSRHGCGRNARGKDTEPDNCQGF
jgi:hypothetical protein